VKKIIMLIAFLLISTAAQAERYEYVSYVNQVIPDFDSVGVTDTIIVPEHILIEDINFFLGIGTPEEPWAEHVWQDVYSPRNVVVRLNGNDVPIVHWYYFWYDTDRPVDGPGDLGDYVGSDAYGPWIMHCYDLFEDYYLSWYHWKIEIYGEPMTSLDDKRPEIPADFVLENIHPNPFNPTATIEFGLPQVSNVLVDVFDIMGRKVITLTDSEFQPGYHSIVWDGHDRAGYTVSSGVYFFRMTAGEKVLRKRAVLLK